MIELGVAAGDVITVQSRRGEVGIHVRRDDGTPPWRDFYSVKLAEGGQGATVMGYGTNDSNRQESAVVS